MDDDWTITDQLSLAEFKELGGGVDPFKIPHGTDWKDERVKAVFETGFTAAFRIRMGLPPNILPKDLPDVLTLQVDASNVKFRLMCSDLIIVACTPGKSGRTGRWEVFNQREKPDGVAQAWYFETAVSLLRADLSKTLDTPYYNNHPAEKALILRQLENLSGTAFSLQQLLFDLDRAQVQSMPEIKGLSPGEPAYQILSAHFKDYYIKLAKEHGWPLLGVTAVAQDVDPSSLVLTNYERMVTVSSDARVTTLDNVCVINKRALPPKREFEWKWVDSSEVNQVSGVISIRRDTLGEILAERLKWMNFSMLMDYKITVEYQGSNSDPVFFFNYDLSPGMSVKKRYPTGPKILDVSFDDTKTKAAGEFMVGYRQYYNCSIYFEKNQITLDQDTLYKLWSKRRQDEIEGELGFTTKDVYDIWVDAGGSLRLTRNAARKLTKKDTFNLAEFQKFPYAGDQIPMMRTLVAEALDASFQDQWLQNASWFVFPGSKVFTFGKPRFSSHQDLVCNLTYLSPSKSLDRGAVSESLGLKMTHSSRLMQNYVQADILSAQGKFQALQTAEENGHALVFAIDLNGELQAIQERSGATAAGWRLNAISRSTLGNHRHVDKAASVRTFGVGQSPVDGTIGMAMGIDSGGADSLYISLRNSSSNLAWLAAPRWTAVPFDDAQDLGSGLRVADVMFTETFDGNAYLVVDVTTNQSGRKIVRYHIDTARATGKAWVKHDVPIDLETGKYQSLVGRKYNGVVDGVYTAGSVAGAPQLIYQPIINVYGEGPPTVTRLSLPEGVPPTAISLVRHPDSLDVLYEATDLYIIAGSKLYRWAADKQKNDSQGEVILEDEILAGTHTLQAMMVDDVVTLWGNNAADEVYYLSCYADDVADPDAWSYPLPIVTDAKRMSAYVNRVDGGNTIFTYGSDKLTQLTQATNTKAKMWRAQQIQLESLPHKPPLSFLSHTTTISLLDDENQPVPDTKLSIWAEAHTFVYINGIYYVLGSEEIQVPTEDMNATILSVSLPGDTLTTVIDPMAGGFDKASTLNTSSSLRGATYAADEVAGGVLDTQYLPLVDPSTPDAPISDAANNMAHFKEEYAKLKPPPKTSRLFYQDKAPRVVRRRPRGAEKRPDGLKSFFAAVGDFFRKVGKVFKDVVKFVKEAAEKVWKFVVQIGEVVLNAVVETVNAVVDGVKWVFDVLKTGWDYVVKFVKFLFSWNDVKRTKQVLHNITSLFLKHQIGQLDSHRVTFGNNIDNVADSLRDWAGISDWSSLGDVAGKPPAGSGQDPSKGHDGSSLLFANHYRDQVNKLEVSSVLPDNSPAEAADLIQVLLDAISDQGEVLSQVFDNLQELLKKAAKLSVTEILKGIAGIIGSAALSSVKVVVDALFRVLISLADSAIGLLDAKLHIPIISDTLNAIGVPDVSFLDLFCWIAAVGYTVIYKVVQGKAPFPDTSDVRAMIAAKSWPELQTVFSKKPAATTDGPLDGLSDIERLMHVTGHSVSGFFLFATNFLAGFEAALPSGDNPFATPTGIVGLIVFATEAVATNIAPRYPVENSAVGGVAWATFAAALVNQLLFGAPNLLDRFRASSSKFAWLKLNDGRAVGDSILTIPTLCCAGYHFFELSKKPAGQERSAAIIGEVYNIASCTATISYAVAVNLKDPVTKPIPIAVMAVANVLVLDCKQPEPF